jgi:osmotically-inducible protein OsmY
LDKISDYSKKEDIMKTVKTIFKNTLLLIMVTFLSSALMAATPISDREISQAVEDELLFNATTPSYLIDVSTYEGIVTLTGSVDNLLARDRATTIAGAIKGVRGVVNNIQIETEYKPDPTLENDVNEALLNDPATDSYEVIVNVENGIATLSGTVDSYQEKQLSEFVAKGVSGLKDINNEINVNYKTNRTDYEIKQEVEAILANDKRIDNALIEVNVDNGNVQLSGIVGSANEKSAAGLRAWTAGVTNVDTENLKVEEWARDDRLRKEKYIPKTDAQILDAVKDAFLYDPRVYSFNPEVSVNYGIVTLTGKVDNLKAKRAAEQDAKNVVGVVRVKNYLKVRPAFIPADRELESDVETSLLKDPVIENWEVDATVNNGVVYLNGQVDSYFEKVQAEDIASRVNGVVAVENNLEINDRNDFYNYDYYGWNTYYPLYHVDIQDEYKTDVEIREDIISQLWWSPYVNEDEVSVTVANGRVILNGIVDTEREKLFAEINAIEGGAEEVENNLVVENNPGN